MKSKLQRILNMVCLCILTVSCSTDENHLLDGCLIDDCNSHIKSRSTSDSGEIIDIVLYGYTTCENKNNIKLKINKEIAESTGLQEGNVYIARYERYTKTVPLKSQCFFEDDENNGCGLKVMSNPANGGYVSMLRGYNEISQNEREAILECYLIHILSDLSGRNLNKYFPCMPNQIEWRGTLYNL